MTADERSIPVVEFTFLGFAFKARDAKTSWGRTFPSFLPGISNKAKKRAGERIREMRIGRRTGSSFEELRNEINEYIRGFMNYFGKFYKSATYIILKRLDWQLTKWVRNKYRKTKKKAYEWLRGVYKRDRDIFEHWKYIIPKHAKGLEQ